ncbi:MAG: O-antigen ligase family protein [Clostridiales bacterium]|nr:O-antigen ligase family protein [Clostridiales bacterium]
MAGGKGKNKNAAAATGQDSHFFEEVMAFLLLAVTFVSLLWQGLLFERDNIPVVIILSALSFIVLLKARVTGEWEIQRPYTAGLFLLLTITSAAALIRAVYPHNAVYAMSKYSSIFLLVLAVQALDRKLPFAAWLTKALAFAGFVYALLGLDAVWGGKLVEGINSALNGGPLAEGEQGFLFDMIMGDRLRSVYQYPNTMASFFIAAWFAAVHPLIHDDVYWKPGKVRRAGLAFSAGAANLLFAAFVLTVSRGMYLVAAVMLILYIIFLPAGRKMRSAGRYALCFIPGLLLGALALPAAPLRSLAPGLGWLLLLLLFALSAMAADVMIRKAPGARVNGAGADTAARKAQRSGAVAARVRDGGAVTDATTTRKARGSGEAAASPTPVGKASAASAAPAGEAAGHGGQGQDGSRIHSSPKHGSAEHGSDPRKLPAGSGLLKRKPAIVAFAALCLCLLAIGVFAWQYSRPMPLGGGQALVRQLRLDKAGGYQVALRFDRPIDQSAADTQIRLEGQTRQEMLRHHYAPYISADLSAYIGEQEIALPFYAPDDEMYFRLSIYDRGAAPGNAIAEVSVVSAAHIGPEANETTTDAAAASTGTAADATADAAAASTGTAAGGGAAAEAAAAGTAAGGGARKIKLNRFLLTESMVRGIETAIHPQTMYERFGFYLDGSRMFLDYPLTGIGGDCWRYLYTSYQRYPYVANDLHSYAMQLIVEYGVGGLLVFLGFLAALAALFIRCVKGRREADVLLLMVAGGLFAHSMIDVDFTFYGHYLVFAIAFALIRFPASRKAQEGGVAAGATASRKAQEGGATAGATALRWGRDALVVAVLVIACLWPFRLNRANSYTAAYFYAANAEDTESAAWLIGQAAKWDPLKPEYKAAEALALGASGVYTAETYARAESLAAAAKRQGQYSGDTLGMLQSYYYRIRHYDEAWEAGLRAAGTDPYRSEHWLSLGKLADDIWFNYSVADVIGANGEVDESARDYEAIRLWLGKGVGLAAEMERASAGRWVPVEAESELAGLMEAWREALASLD